MIRALVLLAALVAAIPAHAAAQRIVTLAPHLAELVCAAGGCERLVGVGRFTDYPLSAARTQMISDAVTVNLEQVLALKPDLILAWDGGTSPENVKRLTGLGLRVEWIRVRSLSGVADALRRVGELMQTQAVANAAADAYSQRLESLRLRYAKAAPLRVLYQIESNPIYTVSSQSPISQAIELCGGINVFAGLPQIAAAVGQEAVLAANPDVVVFALEDGEAKIRAQWAQWPQVTAQKNGNIYAIGADLLARQSPRLLDGVERLCTMLDTARAKQHAAGPSPSSR